MSESSALRSEIAELAEAMCQGRLDAARSTRLDELLRSNLFCQQWFVEYLDLHAELWQMKQERTSGSPSQAAVERVATLLQGRNRQVASRHLLAIVSIATSVAAVLLVGLGVFLWPATPTMARIVTLSENVEWSSNNKTEFAVGSRLEQGQMLSITKGLLTIQLDDGAFVDLRAPCTVAVMNTNRIWLDQGAVKALVGPDAIGFEVHTPDARIVDLGTEFLVERDPKRGTEVSVRQGRVRTEVLDSNGKSMQELELTSGRSLLLDRFAAGPEELAWPVEDYESFDEVTGGLASMEGMARVRAGKIASLLPGEHVTHSHLLVVPERTGVLLREPLVVGQGANRQTIPAGTLVDSYLLHFDFNRYITKPPAGSVSFHRPILAMVSDAAELNLTDELFGAEDVQYPQEDFRGLEAGVDQVALSDDKRTITFDFEVRLPHAMDQCRILVQAE
ncbi:FecR family protein [Calycomorphotria hydatis]|uniref:FecR protein n=1 Tax=Calycomorphotria hydatis TaxID=2528027 RepID=A0A517TCI4_9PLAN|nr:FecR family protein [Calycomorphotria hydatis]QDT66071.1 FecR protein [Calycomorphotria hydatis]